MHHQIKKIIKYYYNLDVNIIECLENRYILNDGYHLYQLINIRKKNEYLLHFHSKHFPKKIYTIFQTISFKYDNETYCLYEYVVSPSSVSINQYVTALYHLNEESLVTQKIDEGFYTQQCAFYQTIIEDTFIKLETIIDDVIYGRSFNVLFFSLIYDYELVNQIKKVALNCLDEYRKIVQEKTTCRFSLSFDNIDFTQYSLDQNCFTNFMDLQYREVEYHMVHLVKSEIEYNDLERLYLSKIQLEYEEKLRLVIQLLCLDLIDFNIDGYKNIVWFSWLKSYIFKINKIMKLLQINLEIMYN